jgi:hypothetical protein
MQMYLLHDFLFKEILQILSDAASQPYAIAADTELLNNKLGRSFPLIDKTDNVNNTGR